MLLRGVQMHQLVPGSSCKSCSGVINMLLISLCHEQTIDFFLFSSVVYLGSMDDGMTYGDEALTLHMLLYAVRCRPMHVYFPVPPPIAVSPRCHFASLQTCKEARYTCGVYGNFITSN